MDGQSCGITVFASPTNFRRSWWHNRDYGLCVANPFAKAAMKQGTADPVTIEPGQSQTFTFGAILHDGPTYDPVKASVPFASIDRFALRRPRAGREFDWQLP